MSNITSTVNSTAFPAPATASKPSHLSHRHLMAVSAVGKYPTSKPLNPSSEQTLRTQRTVNSLPRTTVTGSHVPRTPRLAPPSVIAATAPKNLTFADNNLIVGEWVLENTLAELITAGQLDPTPLRPLYNTFERKRASALALASTHDVLFRADGSLGAIRPLAPSSERKSQKGGFVRPADLQRDRSVSRDRTHRNVNVELVTGVTPHLAKPEGERDGRTCIPRMRREDKVGRVESRIPCRTAVTNGGKENGKIEMKRQCPQMRPGVAGAIARGKNDSKVCSGRVNRFGFLDVNRQ